MLANSNVIQEAILEKLVNVEKLLNITQQKQADELERLRKELAERPRKTDWTRAIYLKIDEEKDSSSP